MLRVTLPQPASALLSIALECSLPRPGASLPLSMCTRSDLHTYFALHVFLFFVYCLLRFRAVFSGRLVLACQRLAEPGRVSRAALAWNERLLACPYPNGKRFSEFRPSKVHYTGWRVFVTIFFCASFRGEE